MYSSLCIIFNSYQNKSSFLWGYPRLARRPVIIQYRYIIISTREGGPARMGHGWLAVPHTAAPLPIIVA